MDLDRLGHEYQCGVLVPLLEDEELAALQIVGLIPAAEARGWEVLRFPIPDGGTPSDLDEVIALVTSITDAARRGQNVVIHCKGGLGRAGTIGGCVLAASGKSAEEALAGVRQARGPNAPETIAQQRFVHTFATRWSDKARG